MHPISRTIRRLADENVAAAVREGFDGEPADYEQTSEDCEYIVREVVGAFGRKPTREEWAEAGFPFVGGAHVGPSERIRAAMEATGLSARSLSRVLGVNERTTRRWLEGQPMPGPAIQLCRALTHDPSLVLALGEE